MAERVQELQVALLNKCNPQLFDATGATTAATEAQPRSLKALAGAVLERNRRCNHHATAQENGVQLLAEKSTPRVAYDLEAPRPARAIPWQYVIADGKAEGVMICACSDPDEVTRFLERLHGGRVIALERIGGRK